MNPYAALCDDFGLYLYMNTELGLPTERDSVLHFFETVRKSYPTMTNFYSRESGDFVLEEEKDSGSYRWAALEAKRVCSGYVNPPTLEAADKQHLQVLDFAPYHFNINALDCEALDVVFAFDFVYNGNHDDVVAEAFGIHNTLESLLNLPQARVIKYEPAIMISLDENLRLQCRLSIETRTSAFQIRTGHYHDEPISVYFTVRQYWQGEPVEQLIESYHRQRATCQELVDQTIIPNVIQPLAQAIAGK